MAALFSAPEKEKLLAEAKRIEDPDELVDWAKSNSLVWLVVLNQLIFKARGPSAVAQVAGVIDKLVKHTGKIIEVPRDRRPVSEPPSEQDGLEESDSGQEDDGGGVEALLADASKFLTGD